MRSIWKRDSTPSPIAVGQFVGNSEDGFRLFQHGAYYDEPNTLMPPSLGVSSLSLEFGFGQRVTLDFGGFYSTAPAPPPEEP